MATWVKKASKELSNSQTILMNDVTALGEYAFVKEGIIPPPTCPCLCFTANTAGSTVTLVRNQTFKTRNFQASTDGVNWEDFTQGEVKQPGTVYTLSNIGDRVYFKGNNPSGLNLNTYSDYWYFQVSGSVSVAGNIMSLLDNGNCATLTIPGTYCFCNMFKGCTALTTASELLLPATTLNEFCYQSMFEGCTALTSAPSLSDADSLALCCYSAMFKGCTSLTSAPVLPATTLATRCYDSMFAKCTALTTAPTLPATSLAYYCYDSMFDGCKALTTPPALPSTTLVGYCYYAMFQGCTSLIVSDTSGEGYDKEWTIPTSGVIASTEKQSLMFRWCAGTRSSNDFAGTGGQSFKYYTQNTPV